MKLSIAFAALVGEVLMLLTVVYDVVQLKRPLLFYDYE